MYASTIRWHLVKTQSLCYCSLFNKQKNIYSPGHFLFGEDQNLFGQRQHGSYKSILLLWSQAKILSIKLMVLVQLLLFDSVQEMQHWFTRHLSFACNYENVQLIAAMSAFPG